MGLDRRDQAVVIQQRWSQVRNDLPYGICGLRNQSRHSIQRDGLTRPEMLVEIQAIAVT